MIDQDFAARLARIALGHVRREYPYKPGNVLGGPMDARTPSELHPVFHGSFDWHSCVHSYWLLARVLRRFPEGAVAGEIRALFDEQLVDAKVAGECATFAGPGARGFERPYGWAWLLKLAAELALLPMAHWSAALRPLATLIAGRFGEFLPIATYPVRTGSHGNTALALLLAADYPDPALRLLLRRTAARWYGDDADCPAWGEPGGDDFLSPTLVEAACMQVLQPDDFCSWFARFLPRLAEREPATLFRPAIASDRSDGKIAHLDGLNLSRAWCMRRLPHAAFEEAAAAHVAAAMPHLDGHYMGAHWLATYAMLAVEGGDS